MERNFVETLYVNSGTINVFSFNRVNTVTKSLALSTDLFDERLKEALNKLNQTLAKERSDSFFTKSKSKNSKKVVKTKDVIEVCEDNRGFNFEVCCSFDVTGVNTSYFTNLIRQYCISKGMKAGYVSFKTYEASEFILEKPQRPLNWKPNAAYYKEIDLGFILQFYDYSHEGMNPYNSLNYKLSHPIKINTKEFIDEVNYGMFSFNKETAKLRVHVPNLKIYYAFQVKYKDERNIDMLEKALMYVAEKHSGELVDLKIEYGG